MNIRILWPWELPEKIKGVAVVADIMAATTNIVSMVSRGVGKLILASQDSVVHAKHEYPNSLVVGESLVLPKDFFAVSNFPQDIEKTNFSGKTIIFITSNRTRVIEKALKLGAEFVVTLSFTNISSIAKWIIANQFTHITLIPAGTINVIDPTLPEEKIPEDLYCIEALKGLLEGKEKEITRKLNQAADYLEEANGLTADNPNFWPVFTLNRFKVVPVCRQIEAGLIEVTDAIRGQKTRF